ncbi:MAG: hypothetical protein ACPGU1_21735 [Myxococcota bacterium]
MTWVSALLALVGMLACQSGGTLPPVSPDDTPPLRIGVNPTSLEDTALFRPLEEGDELAIEFGFQGLWMVVLAFQSEGLEGRVTVVARVRTEAGDVIGEFGLAKQVLVAGDDGYDYYLNLYLIVEGVEAVGQRAWVELEVEDAGGLSLERTIEVVLTRSDNDSGVRPSDDAMASSDAVTPEPDVGPSSAD